MADFGPVGSQNDFGVPANPQSLCTHPKLEWYRDTIFLSPAPALRPFPVKAMLLHAFGLLGFATSAAAASVGQFASWVGGGDEPAQTVFRDKIIGSWHVEHGAGELCASSTSYGPDFVSFADGVFCDMKEKKPWPLCGGSVTRKCYDWESHTVVDGWRRKREVRYARVEEWR